MAVSVYFQPYSILTATNSITQQFHSDEEVGLGPLVAGLSLGSPAFMHFRLQRKHDRAGERKGILMSFILRHVSCSSALSCTDSDRAFGNTGRCLRNGWDRSPKVLRVGSSSMYRCHSQFHCILTFWLSFGSSRLGTRSFRQTSVSQPRHAQSTPSQHQHMRLNL